MNVWEVIGARASSQTKSAYIELRALVTIGQSKKGKLACNEDTVKNTSNPLVKPSACDSEIRAKFGRVGTRKHNITHEVASKHTKDVANSTKVQVPAGGQPEATVKRFEPTCDKLKVRALDLHTLFPSISLTVP